MTLSVTGHTEQDATRMQELFTADRQNEWAGILADCAKFDAEIDKELRNQKLTMAELRTRSRARSGRAALLCRPADPAGGTPLGIASRRFQQPTSRPSHT